MNQNSAVLEGPVKKLNFGSLCLQTRYLLSPLAGYTNLAFRTVVRQFGGLGLATTDLINAKALLVGSKKTMELIETCGDDRPLAVQIYGAKPDEMADAARWLQDYGASVIDINMGCPVNKVTKGGGGSALMCSRRDTIKLVETVAGAVSIPVTVKMRLGWDNDHWTAPDFAQEFEQVGAAAIIIHGRTREQGFSGKVNLDGIRAVADAVDRIPVIGNGDVCTLADADRMLRQTGCDGISIGRGALLNPWIFAQLRHWEQTGEVREPATYEDRLHLMSQHFHLLLRYRGEHIACLAFRKVANWYCKVLRPGRQIQLQLVNIDSASTFDAIVNQLLDSGEPEHWWRYGPGVEQIVVPKGPISHW